MNFSDIFFRYYFSDRRRCLHNFNNHTIVYIYEGEIEIYESNSFLHLKKGECAFIGRGNKIFMRGNPEGNNHFNLIFMAIPRNFLCEFYHTIDLNKISGMKKKKITLSKIPIQAEINSLFQSFVPYFRQPNRMSEEFIHLKVAEAIYALIRRGDQLNSTLFDFSKPNGLSILEILTESSWTTLKWISQIPYNDYNLDVN